MRRHLIAFVLFAFLVPAAFSATGYESLDTINSFNWPGYFADYLGFLYDSHGCLHYSPSDIFLLTRTIPKGSRLEIKHYADKSVPSDWQRLPYFNEEVKDYNEISWVAKRFRQNQTKLVVYPALARTYILVNDQPYVQVKTQPGPPTDFLMVVALRKGGPIRWDFGLSTSTDPGEYRIYGTRDNYRSPTYPLTTTVPFGAWIMKSGGYWVFQLNEKWYRLPGFIADDLARPEGERLFNYYDINYDNKLNVTAARWGSHDFGRSVLLWTRDGKYYCPEMGYAEGELVFEEVTLVRDLAELLTIPGKDELDDLAAKNENFKLYKACFEFIESAGEKVSPLLDPLSCSYYRLYNGLSLTATDRQRLDPRLLEAVQLVKAKRKVSSKTLGLYYYVRDYTLMFQKQANWYGRVKSEWAFWQKLRLQLRTDFTTMGIASTDVRQLMVQDWLEKRLEFHLIEVGGKK